jgi:hypothetical protein
MTLRQLTIERSGRIALSIDRSAGMDLVRYYTFDEDGRLRLSTPPIDVGGRSLEYVLLRERIP